MIQCRDWRSWERYSRKSVVEVLVLTYGEFFYAIFSVEQGLEGVLDKTASLVFLVAPVLVPSCILVTLQFLNVLYSKLTLYAGHVVFKVVDNRDHQRLILLATKRYVLQLP